MKLGLVYFIQSGNFVKIGYTKSGGIEQRFNALQSCNPIELKILGLIKTDIKHERFLHKRFKRYWVRGEWFELCPEIWEYIYKNTYCPDINFEKEMGFIRVHFINNTRKFVENNNGHYQTEKANGLKIIEDLYGG